MFWVGGNSNGNLTWGAALRVGSGGGGWQEGCIGQSLGCVVAALSLVAIGLVMWGVIEFVRFMINA
jgi:hypothetical protein